MAIMDYSAMTPHYTTLAGLQSRHTLLVDTAQNSEEIRSLMMKVILSRENVAASLASASMMFQYQQLTLRMSGNLRPITDIA